MDNLLPRSAVDQMLLPIGGAMKNAVSLTDLGRLALVLALLALPLLYDLLQTALPG